MPTEIALLPDDRERVQPDGATRAVALRASGSSFRRRASTSAWSRTGGSTSDATSSPPPKARSTICSSSTPNSGTGISRLPRTTGARVRCVVRSRANTKRGLPTDYLSLKMPAETRQYVPKLQAVKNIINEPESFGLDLADIPDAPYFAVVRTTRKMDVKIAAELAEMPAGRVPVAQPAAQPAGDRRRGRCDDVAALRQGRAVRREARAV